MSKQLIDPVSVDTKPAAIFLMGPTASGKTGLAVELAKRLPVEIISVDSALVYRGMDIGAAKPGAEVLSVAPHRLIDIRDPKDPYTAADFRRDALEAMAEITSEGRVPLLVGGTMLYFNVLLKGIAPMPPADPEIRAQLLAQAEQHGWGHLHKRLAKIDPKAAARIHPNDPQRMQRALEVYEITGKSLTELQESTTKSILGGDKKQAHGGEVFPYFPVSLAVAPENRVILHERIAIRLRQMLDDGLVQEVRGLYERGDLSAGLPALKAVGYRQVWEYLAGKLTYDEMVARAIVATRQLAKRQYTWLRRWPELTWLDADAPALTEKALAVIHAKLKKGSLP